MIEITNVFLTVISTIQYEPDFVPGNALVSLVFDCLIMDEFITGWKVILLACNFSIFLLAIKISDK